jgi:hypothetical protein
VEETVRTRFGKTQEPELTLLKGVGPFAVALYRGASALGDFDTGTPLPAGTAVREVRPDYAQAMLANVVGSGAVAQGDGAVAVGERAVHVGGSNKGAINTGHQVSTGGGAYVGGNVSAGRDFIGRDRISAGVGQQALQALFAPLLAAVAAQAPPDQQAEAVQQVQELQAEAARGEQADDGAMARIIDGLAELVARLSKSADLSGFRGSGFWIVNDMQKVLELALKIW